MGVKLRMKVEVNISKPLRCFMTINLGKRKEDICGRFTYERLTLFCYKYGLIGHGEIKCELATNKKEDSEVRQYGDWLHATVGGKSGSTFQVSTLHRRGAGESIHLASKLFKKRMEKLADGRMENVVEVCGASKKVSNLRRMEVPVEVRRSLWKDGEDVGGTSDHDEQIVNVGGDRDQVPILKSSLPFGRVNPLQSSSLHRNTGYTLHGKQF
ncbi:hypothetical protein PTKIN_Ptkin13bG0027100 [Pterospermum kingtungense]